MAGLIFSTGKAAAVAFRRLFKRAVKPFVMVTIAGALAVSLTVTTTVKAEATPVVAVLPVVAAAEAVLGGGVAISMPSLLMSSLALHPVGWGIAAAVAIGVGLYATKDYWLPYVNGDFGKAKQDTPADLGAGVLQGLLIPETTPHVIAAGYVTYASSYVGTTEYPNGVTVGYTYRIACKKADGTVYTRLNEISGFTGTGTSYGRNNNVTLNCAYANETPVGAILGAFGSSPDLSPKCANSAYPCGRAGPQNVVRWGTLETPGFDPKSPDAKYRAEVECVSSDGTKSLISAVTAGDVGAIRMPSCEAAGKGHGTGAYKIYGTPPGTTIEGTAPLETQAAPSADPSRPLCDPNKGGAPCKLGVMLDGKPCAIGSFECMNWSSLKNDPNWSTRLSCQYGVYAVPMASCNPLERAYEPGGAPATDANTDGNPDTRSDTNATGQPQPKPDAGTGTGVIPGSGASGVPQGSTPEQAECFPSGWAMLNPVEWVMKPVGCALDSAFKPKKDLQTRLTGMQTQFSNKVPVSWFGVGVQGASGGVCPADWAVNYDGHSYSLICGTAADNIIRGFRPVLGSMLIMAMLWPFIRSLFYAAIPVFKVNPS